eukprot:1436087-Rhodomonas_salina.3
MEADLHVVRHCRGPDSQMELVHASLEERVQVRSLVHLTARRYVRHGRCMAHWEADIGAGGAGHCKGR